MQRAPPVALPLALDLGMASTSRVSIGWAVAFAGMAALAALAASPPVIGGEAGAWVRHAFSAVCHQIPERSPHLAGAPVALCHRCSGILAGLVLGVGASPLLSAHLLGLVNRSRQGRWLLAALAPTALDWASAALGLWPNTPVSRVATGMIFGAAAGVILGANLLRTRSPQTQPPLAHAV